MRGILGTFIRYLLYGPNYQNNLRAFWEKTELAILGQKFQILQSYPNLLILIPMYLIGTPNIPAK